MPKINFINNWSNIEITFSIFIFACFKQIYTKLTRDYDLSPRPRRRTPPGEKYHDKHDESQSIINIIGFLQLLSILSTWLN